VKSGEIRIAYCPTGLMIADYFTKPLQGVLFKQLRDMIMGNIDISLPPDEASQEVPTVAPSGIPPARPRLESRSVLGNETAKLAQARPARASILTVLPGKPASISKLAESENHPLANSKPISSKPSLSWADIARPK
jgi:hypothetical protein